MKSINIACAATLAWVLVFGFDGPEQREIVAKDAPVITEDTKIKPNIEKESVVEPDDAPAEIFPRPRKPCPSGPGKR